MDRDPKTGMYVDYASNVVLKKGKLLKYLVIWLYFLYRKRMGNVVNYELLWSDIESDGRTAVRLLITS